MFMWMTRIIILSLKQLGVWKNNLVPLAFQTCESKGILRFVLLYHHLSKTLGQA